MTDLAVVGCGHVGLVAAGCFARMGHHVQCIDVDAERIAMLRVGLSPLHEPGLDELIQEGLTAGRLAFHAGIPEELTADIVFIAVNASADEQGDQTASTRDVIEALAPRLRPGAIIVNKSTLPIGTGDRVEQWAGLAGAPACSVVSNPEFLRQGTAVRNFLEPERVVLGSSDPLAIERVAALYEPLGAPILRTDLRTAEMVKYASNAFLATKISFINEIATICEAVGADVSEVAAAMGADPRIGSDFLRAGLGWGGGCLPKDVEALARTAAEEGAHPQLLHSVMQINHDQLRRVVEKVRQALDSIAGRRILVLGAAFKPHTDDTRHSPALALADMLQLEGAEVAVYDPVVSAGWIRTQFPHLAPAPDLLEGARDADAVVLATEWPQFAKLPLPRMAELMARRLIVDARNFLVPAEVCAAGFEYVAIGRPAVSGTAPTGAEPRVAATAVASEAR